MEYEMFFNVSKDSSFLILENDIIIDVSTTLLEMIDYEKASLIGRNILEFCYELRITPSINVHENSSDLNYYLFTQKLEYRNFTLKSETFNNYHMLILSEIPNSRFENKFNTLEKLIMDNRIGVGIYSAPDLVLLKANQTYLNIFDDPFKKFEVAIGLDINRFVDWSMVNGAYEIFMGIVNTGNSFYGKEIKGITGNYKNNYWDNTLFPVMEDGKVKYVVSMVDEVTDRVLERKRNEEQALFVEEQRFKLEAIIKNISDGVFVVDKNENVLLLNDEAKKYINNYETIDKLYDFFDDTVFYDLEGKAIPYDEMPLQRALKGDIIKNFEACTKINGKEIIVECNASPIRDKYGSIVMAIVCTHDITKKYLYKHAIEAQLEMLSKLINNLDLPVIRLSYPDLTILDTNQKKYKFIKSINSEIKSMKDIKGKSYTDVVLNPCVSDDVLNCIDEAVTKKKSAYIKNRKWVIDGEEKYTTTLYQPIIGFNNNVEEIVGVVFDVSAEVKASNNMQTTLKLQEEFFANISHELKTPLNIIYTTTQLLNMYLKNDSFGEKKSSVIKHIDTVKQNCYRLSKLINNIVDLSKIEAGFYELNLTNNNIVEVVEEIVMSVSDYIVSRGLNIVFDTEIEEKIIACDPEKIERIVLNLISNAIKFSDEGQEICVNIKNNRNFVEIVVKDNGIGIDSNNLNIIFDRFKQVDKSLSRNAEGTGIGLSLVKSIAELHGGNVSAESELGKGSVFIISLPSRMVEQENTKVVSKMRNNQETVLVEFSDLT